MEWSFTFGRGYYTQQCKKNLLIRKGDFSKLYKFEEKKNGNIEVRELINFLKMIYTDIYLYVYYY